MKLYLERINRIVELDEGLVERFTKELGEITEDDLKRVELQAYIVLISRHGDCYREMQISDEELTELANELLENELDMILVLPEVLSHLPELKQATKEHRTIEIKLAPHEQD